MIFFFVRIQIKTRRIILIILLLLLFVAKYVLCAVQQVFSSLESVTFKVRVVPFYTRSFSKNVGNVKLNEAYDILYIINCATIKSKTTELEVAQRLWCVAYAETPLKYVRLAL